jgi:two-component system cell cycle sensor histidine kinase/response regulator CckA
MKRILIVDDDASVREVLTRALSSLYDVSAAHDGPEALTLAEQRQVDLVITDYLMPVMTGEELIVRFREVQPSAKVLVITGHGDVLDREGPDWWRDVPHLGKPFRIQALRETVASMFA